jgi:hypothetical protein
MKLGVLAVKPPTRWGLIWRALTSLDVNCSTHLTCNHLAWENDWVNHYIWTWYTLAFMHLPAAIVNVKGCTYCNFFHQTYHHNHNHDHISTLNQYICSFHIEISQIHMVLMLNNNNNSLLYKNKKFNTFSTHSHTKTLSTLKHHPSHY